MKMTQQQLTKKNLTMVDYYMEKGFNYFDTSYAYPNGQSEIAIKKSCS